MDPYEQQLLSVFNSYDLENRGSLDRESLSQLCQTLQLEEQGSDLIRCLLTEPKKPRATFCEFKDALLALLANVQNQNPDNGSPDREISPKFVYGSKKYGRRSKPKIEENQKSPDDNGVNKNNVKVQRSNSQSDANFAKKRKPNTNGKLKRCTSFSGVVDCDKNITPTSIVVNESVLTSNDSLLFSGMQFITLGPDGNGIVSSDVVLEMWESAGISSPKSLLNDLGFLGSQISITELALVLEKELKMMQSPIDSSYLNTSNPHIILLQASLALYQSEICCLKSIIEQMHQEREKLKGDVFDANNRATLLAQEVDDNHIKMEKSTEKHVRLLEQRHSDALRDMSEQLTGEKEHLSTLNTKLEQKVHILETQEAKLRADLEFAQKVTATLETETRDAAKLLLKTEDAKTLLVEKLQSLESERQEYESERVQIEPLLSKLSALQLENTDLRDKNDELCTEIECLCSELSLLKHRSATNATGAGATAACLNETVDNLPFICEVGGTGAVKRRGNSPSKEFVAGDDGSPRLGKVRKCHGNNGAPPPPLLESAGLQPPAPVVVVVPSTSSESGFEADLDSSLALSMSGNELEEIARLQSRIAVLEKELCHHGIAVPCDTEHSATANRYDRSEILQVQQQCKTLQQLLYYTRSELSKILTENVKHDPKSIEKMICELKKKLEPCLFETDNDDDAAAAATLSDDKTTNELLAISSATTTDVDNETQTKLDCYARENEQLVKKCADLELGIDLLRTEYEKCEDYWASKLDDERQMYEQEQSQSNEKLADLLTKMAEYEEQFANCADSDAAARLPTIEEKYGLEKQFTDLEEEFDEYRQNAEQLLNVKDQEITSLKDQLRITTTPKQTAEFGCQFAASHASKAASMNLNKYVIESTNLFSVDTMPQFSPPPPPPITVTATDDVDPSSKAAQRDYVNPNYLWNKQNAAPSPDNNSCSTRCESSKCDALQQPYSSILSVSSTHSNEQQNNSTNSTPCRPKRTRKYERNQLSCSQQRLHKKENVDKDGGASDRGGSVCSSRFAPSREDQHFPGQQTCVLPVTTIHNLNRRLHQLDQRCRQLQHVLKQQHHVSEQILQQTWQQHRGEKAEMHYLLKANQEKLDQQIRACNDQLERLSRTDMLVKDLYVENAYLIANVQRLEQHCHILTQCNTASSSV